MNYTYYCLVTESPDVYHIFRVDSKGAMELNFAVGWQSSPFVALVRQIIDDTDFILLTEEKAKFLFNRDITMTYPFYSPSVPYSSKSDQP